MRVTSIPLSTVVCYIKYVHQGRVFAEYMLQYITQVHVEYRQKVNRCGLHTERNGMKTPVAKYLVGADERICQDLWW